MKKSTLSLLLVFTLMHSKAQDYLISFAGTGDTTQISTVKVENLNSGVSVTLNGGDILHLVQLTGINKPAINTKGVQVYPNPMSEQSVLTFSAPVNGSIAISIVDLSGKTVFQTSMELSSGIHSFNLSGLYHGMYFVRISGKNYSYSTKLLSEGQLKSIVKIAKISSVGNTSGNPLKSSSAIIDMPYTTGDQLRYTSISGPYSTVVTDVPAGNKTVTFNFARCKDGDGNNYAIITIGTQTWMVENLKTTKYSDGTPIPLVTGAQWADRILPAYCWYNNDSVTYITPYGALYNWYAVTSANGLAPKGWHIPSSTELATLTNYCGGDMVAGNKLKERGITHWKSPNLGATNESGFTALPGGLRRNDGPFLDINKFGIWWSSTYDLQSQAWQWTMAYDMENAHQVASSTSNGLSVRCIRNY